MRPSGDRAKSLKTVETVFASIVLVCTGCGLIVHISGTWLNIPDTVQQPVSIAFLITAVAGLVVLLGCSAWLSRP